MQRLPTKEGYPFALQNLSLLLVFPPNSCFPSLTPPAVMAKVFSQEIELQVSAKRMWYGFVKDSHNCLPKALPQKIAAVEYTEAQATEVGCVRTLKFHKGYSAETNVLYVKEKIEEVDHESLKYTTVLVEGGSLGTTFKSFKSKFEFKEGAHANTCVVHWTIKYETVTEQQEFPDRVKEGIISTLKEIEAYLLKHKDYAA